MHRDEPVKFSARAVRAPRAPRSSRALKLLMMGALGELLYLGHAAFVPVALAALIALVLSGPVESLRGFGLPRAAGALLMMLIIGAILGGLADLLAEPAQHWFAEAPRTLNTIARRIRPVARIVVRIDELRASASAMGSAPHAAAVPASADTLAAPSAPVMLFNATVGFCLSSVTVLVLTLFLLTGGPPMLARMTSALVSDLNSAHVLAVIEQVRGEVGRFYVTTALINVGLGLATGCVMMACRMPNPFLWGTLVGALNFIPYAGPSVSFLLLTAVAMVSFDGLAPVLTVAGSFLGLTILEAHFVQPLLVGRRLELNPLLVFLALWFGGFFWGLAGIILATPTLVALKVIAQHSTHSASLMRFLSPQPPGEPARSIQPPRMQGRAIA